MPKSIAPLAPRAERSTKSASILLLLLQQATKHLHTARDARRARHNRQAAARPARRDKLHVVLSHQSLPVTHPAEFLAMDLLLAAATCSNQLFVAAADVPPAARTTQRHQDVDVTICLHCRSSIRGPPSSTSFMAHLSSSAPSSRHLQVCCAGARPVKGSRSADAPSQARGTMKPRAAGSPPDSRSRDEEEHLSSSAASLLLLLLLSIYLSSA